MGWIGYLELLYWSENLEVGEFSTSFNILKLKFSMFQSCVFGKDFTKDFSVEKNDKCLHSLTFNIFRKVETKLLMLGSSADPLPRYETANSTTKRQGFLTRKFRSSNTL